MDAIEQQSMPFPDAKKRTRRMRRGIFLLPSIMTGANLLCGYYASLAALSGGREDFDHAAKAIGIAILFDSLDGRIARMTGTNTEFGVQFDSLADVVSFGIAPAILAYAWGYRSMTAGNADTFLGHFAWLCCLAFLICSAWRLARFNVKGMEPGGSKNFVGMPTPAAAGVVAAVVHACHWLGPIDDQRWSYGWFVLLPVLGALMTSTVRYYSFKDIPWARKQPSITIILVVMLVGIIWRYSEYALVIIAGTYALAGIILHILRVFRHRTVARTA
ncbi:MAG TPA: CDP-diacylglycerol--serine O-phosphatidyltransferase [Candidatus Acidoferrum sp.]|jgi:CDP-diacylglycerol--serine O-phosphatidyltransferase|nr:CDP-diacylglycerol--serine O-phosphatidyltransferase [Candidatus Acidoferrum sp.]